MKRIMAIIACAVALNALAVASGDHVVINDQEYVVIHVNDWCNVTNRVRMLEDVATDRWNKQHSTDAGRRAWHGTPKSTVITNGETVVTYGDGYIYREQNKQVKKPLVGKAKRIQQARKETIDAFIERRRLAKEKRLRAISVTNEVTTVIMR